MFQARQSAAGADSDRLDSRFCSGQKFLLGFRDLFFCLFLESVSGAPSESSSALFWHTVFFTSELWLLPLATGSFGLQGMVSNFTTQGNVSLVSTTVQLLGT